MNGSRAAIPSERREPDATVAASPPVRDDIARPGAPRLDVAGVLALQRSVGNRAVQTLIARGGSDGGTAAPPPADLAALVAARKWPEAIAYAQTLSDEKLVKELDALGYDDVAELCSQADKMLPGAAGVRKTAEPIRVRKHAEAYAAAVAARDWRRAARLANAFSESDLMAKLKELNTAGKLPDMDTAAQVEIPTIGPRVHRHISFILHGPAAAGTESSYTVSTPGTERSKGKAGGGDVRAITGTKEHTTGGSTDVTAFELEYKGAEAAKTHWLQFITRAVWGEKAGTPNAFVTATVSSTGLHTYDLTTDLAKPNWNTDSADATQPFYHAQGVSQRDATRNAMADGMSARTDFAAQAFRAGADTVVSQATFATYLVRDMDVLYRYDIVVQWKFERATHWDAVAGRVKSTPDPNMQVPGAAVVKELLPAHRARLVVDYPTHDYLP